MTKFFKIGFLRKHWKWQISSVIAFYPLDSNSDQLDFLWIERSVLEWRKAQCLKITQNVAFEFFKSIFWHFWITQNVNVAHFVRNIECDYFCKFSNTVLRKGLISRLLLLASRDATLRGSSTTSRILPNVIQERKGQWSHWQHLCSWKAFFSILSYMMWNLLKLIEFSEDLAWKLFAETKFNFYSTTFVTFFHGVWKS